jgi:hypothetical protein
MIAFSGLLTVGVVCALACITVLAAKIFLWVIAPELAQILQLFLVRA